MLRSLIEFLFEDSRTLRKFFSLLLKISAAPEFYRPKEISTFRGSLYGVSTQFYLRRHEDWIWYRHVIGWSQLLFIIGTPAFYIAT